ncbi:hypothetical protein ACRAWG_19880 [Methylobacterium sp. P31]
MGTLRMATARLTAQAVDAQAANGLRAASSLSFGLAVSLISLVGGPAFIAFATTSGPVRDTTRICLLLAALAPLAAAPFAYGGIYIGATWTRVMRNLMLCARTAYGAVPGLNQALGLGNAGPWLAFVAFLGARGLGQAIAFPALARGTFSDDVLPESQPAT